MASRLALRWAAQQPHTVTPDSPSRLNEGRLRHPTQGKPARHSGSHSDGVRLDQALLFGRPIAHLLSAWRCRTWPLTDWRGFKVFGVLVASRLALRWAAQQPHTVTPDSPSRLNEGRLRHPTQGKPARHSDSHSDCVRLDQALFFGRPIARLISAWRCRTWPVTDWRVFKVCGVLVASRLALRWAA